MTQIIPCNTMDTNSINVELARKIIATQFPEFTHLAIESVDHQGYDNRTYRLEKAL